MKNAPIGLARGRHVEITTKHGHTVAGSLLRVKAPAESDDQIVYLRFTANGTEAVVTVDLADVEVLIIGPNDSDEDEDADA